MKSLKLILCMLLLGASEMSGGVIVIEGHYQLRNLYVVNGETASGVGFCTVEVTVNGDVTNDEWNSTAFEVDLSQYGFEMGDPVMVQISYKEDCEPRILNPGALKPAPTFEVKDITIADNILSWETVNEQGMIPYIVQQYKWNKWVKIGEVQGVGTSNLNTYEFKVEPVSGQNRFRVIQKSYEGKVRKSPDVSFASNQAPVEFSYDRKRQLISFTRSTSYEIYNKYGQIIKRGVAKEVDVSPLRRSNYYLTYDNATDEFTKK